MTGSPAIFLPEDQRQRHVLVLERLASDQLGQGDRFALGVGQLDADHAAARDGRDARRQRRHVAGDVVGQLDHPAGLDPARRLELVHGDDRARADLDDVAADVEILEHRFEQARVALEPGAVDLLLALLGRRARAGRRSAARRNRRAPGSAAHLRPWPRGRRRRSRARARRPRPSGASAAARPESRRSSSSISVRRGAARRSRGSRFSNAAEPAALVRREAEREIADGKAGEREQQQARRAASGPATCGLRIRPIAASTPCAAASPSAPPQPPGRPDTAEPLVRPSAIPISTAPIAASSKPRPIRPAGSRRSMRRPAMAITGKNSTAPSPNRSSSASLK